MVGMRARARKKSSFSETLGLEIPGVLGLYNRGYDTLSMIYI